MSAVLNAVIIGFSFLFTKIALDYAQPLDTLMYRFAVSFAAISIPSLFGKWKKFQRDPLNSKLDFTGKPLYKTLFLAALYPISFFSFQTFGLERATSAEGGILFAFIPVMTLILASLFLKEATTIWQKLSIFLSGFGVVFIFISQGAGIDIDNMTGILLLLFSCFAVAGYNVLARSLLKIYRPIEISYLLSGIGFSVFVSISLMNHISEGTLNLLLMPLTNGLFIISIGYLGVLSSLVTSLLTNYALSKIEASRISVFSNLSTVVSIIAGALLLDERITVYHLFGSVLIIGGVLGTYHLDREKFRKVRLHVSRYVNPGQK
ncbi:DMT family transporter [Siminovitchia sp. 179-K 8D1 HS]|uniref:DMT family transporter n=1 Tax=Siminovitchia sp. 179-K 8D1 HS TaxID=3142385 RepID=UPI0039A0720B